MYSANFAAVGLLTWRISNVLWTSGRPNRMYYNDIWSSLPAKLKCI